MEFNPQKQLAGLLEWMDQQMTQCGGKTAVIGISGGKDSSTVAALAEENDIVELRLLHGSRTVTAGSSSDYTPQKGFFDKRYYVGSKEMETIDDFRRALEPYAPGSTVTVLTIDGVKPQ